MKTIKSTFQYLSYLQYPLITIGIFYSIKPLFFGIETYWQDINAMLIFMGLAISYSTLQDITKVQNKFSEKVWKNPRYAKYFLVYLMVMIFLILIFGLYGYFFSTNEKLQEVAFGTFVFGIGMIGVLKMSIEMADYQQQKVENEED